LDSEALHLQGFIFFASHYHGNRMIVPQNYRWAAILADEGGLRAPSGEIASEVSIDCEKPDRCGRSQEEVIIGVLSRWARYFYGWG